ncbi:MAG: hypothetical protein ABIR62_03720 [Dokdonella sp.]|uniref:hypothetical protein n=1 Tax=Dokdonella sp. TaxID=2291710 RepID=UPI0032641FC4
MNDAPLQRTGVVASARHFPVVFATVALLMCASVCGAMNPDAGIPVADASTSVDSLPPSARPAGVPDGYLVTPNGYFHPDCVQRVGSDERVLADGSIAGPAGQRRASPACIHAHFSKAGTAIGPYDRAQVSDIPGQTATADTLPPTINGYTVSATFVVSNAVPKVFAADMLVPTAPSSAGDQTIYLFPGLEDIEDVQTILQPVLAWNGFGDHAWSVASWNCCKDGTTFHSDPLAVSAGETINGVMTGSNCSGDVCTNWAVSSKRGAESTVLNTQSYGQRFDWVFGAALEVYGVQTCEQQPASALVRFTNERLTGMNGTAIALQPWNGAFFDSLFGSGFDARYNIYCAYQLNYGDAGRQIVILWPH